MAGRRAWDHAFLFSIVEKLRGLAQRACPRPLSIILYGMIAE
jgi:hypothetical protein